MRLMEFTACLCGDRCRQAGFDRQAETGEVSVARDCLGRSRDARHGRDDQRQRYVRLRRAGDRRGA